MSVIGQDVTVARADDPTKVGRKGVVVLETANTLLLQSGDARCRVEKQGSVFLLGRSGDVVNGDEIAGRLEDRLGGRSR